MGPGTYNNMMVPKRWLYPQTEYDYNRVKSVNFITKPVWRQRRRKWCYVAHTVTEHSFVVNIREIVLRK